MRKPAIIFTMMSVLILLSLTCYSDSPFPIDAWAYAGPDDNVCEGGSYTPWLAAAIDYTSLLWTTSGTGSFDDPTIVYATYTPGIGELGPVVLTLTAYAFPPGNDDSDDMTLNILDGPEASFSITPSSAICLNEQIMFSGSSTTAIILWEWDFGDGNTANTQNVYHTYMFAGTYNVSLIVTNTEGCKDTVIQSVNIYELPVCEFTSSPSDTASVNTLITFSGSGTTSIISWDWDFGDGNTANGQIVNHAYSAPGTYYVVLMVYNVNSCTDTAYNSMVIIDPIIDFIMTPSPSCEGYMVSYSGMGGVGPGTYDWDFGDGSTATGQNVSHIYINAGIYLVSLEYASEQIQKNLEVVAPAYAFAGADDWMCSNIPYTLSGSALNYSATMWESSGDGFFDDPTLLDASYSPGSADIAAGSVMLSLLAYAQMPCTNDTSVMMLSIQAVPVSNAGTDTASCDGAPIMLNGAVSNEDSHSWSTAGDGSFDDPGLLNATYTPGSNDLSNGSVILTLTAFAIPPCDTDSADDLILDLPISPTCSAGDDDQMCNNNPYTLNGTATNYSSVLWTSSGDGTFDDPALLSATYTPGIGDIANGSVSLTLSTIAIEPCNDVSDDMILDIQPPPIANAGDDAGICEGENIPLYGTASDYTSIIWSSDGDGNFDDPNSLNPIYTPGSGDIGNGGASLTLVATPIAPCTIGMTDAMALGIDPAVGSPTTPQGPEIIDSYLTPTSDYQTQTTAAADEYKWTLSPSSAGNISGTGLVGSITWEPAYQGFAYVRVTAFNSCNSISSDSLEVNVTTSVGLSDFNQTKVLVKITPNPNKGVFSVKINGIQHELELTIHDNFGRIIMQISTGQSESFEQNFNLSYLPKGMYIMKLFGPYVIHTEKIIIQ